MNMRHSLKATISKTLSSPFRVFVLSAMLLCQSNALWAQSNATVLSNYLSLPFTLNNTVDRVTTADLNKDGLVDILTANTKYLSVYLQKNNTFNFNKADGEIELPGVATGWGVEAGRIYALVDGKTLLAWSFENAKLSVAKTILESLPGHLPNGFYPLKLHQDINDDGLPDLMIPGTTSIFTYLQTSTDNYEQGFEIHSRIRNYSRLVSDGDLSNNVGQSIVIPTMAIRDVNNDQRKDLIARSDERLEVFIADSEGNFALQASYNIDLEEIEERVGEVDFDTIDYGNLSGLLAHTYDVNLEDTDGDGIEDLLLREAGKISVFSGTKYGMNLDRPKQVLKSGGNVLTALLIDEDGDGLKELCLMRLEEISIGNLFVWLAISGSVDIETFIYKNNGNKFSNRPHRKLTLSVKFPSILKTYNLVTETRENSAESIVRTALGNSDENTQQLDVFALGEKHISVYLNGLQRPAAVAPDIDFEDIGHKGYSAKRDNYELDLGDSLRNTSIGDKKSLQVINNQQASFNIAIAPQTEIAIDTEIADLIVGDLNGDKRDDIMVFNARSESSVSGYLLLSQ